MELDTKKKKYRLSSSTTPSPSEENKSFSNGFYHKNITGFEGEPSTTNGKGTPAFDNLAYASHDDDNVFKPKTDIYFDPSSLQRNQKGHLSRVESAREENVPKKKGEKGCLILLFVLTVLGLLAGVAVIVYVQVFKEKSSSPSIHSPVILVGSVTLKDAWNEELRSPLSLIYNTTAANITSEMDSIMQNGKMSKLYIETKVLSFSPGSIVSRLEIYFQSNYGSVFKNTEELASAAEFEIIGASEAGYTNLDIQSVNLTGEIKTSTSSPATQASTTTSTSKSTETSTSSMTVSSTSSTLGPSSPSPSTGTATTPKPTTTTSKQTTTTPEPTSTTPEPTTTTPEPTTTTQEPTTMITPEPTTITLEQSSTNTPKPTTTTPEPTTTTPEPTTTMPELTTTIPEPTYTPEPTTTTPEPTYTPEPTTTTPEPTPTTPEPTTTTMPEPTTTTTTPEPTTTTTPEPTTTTTPEPTTTTTTPEPTTTTPEPTTTTTPEPTTTTTTTTEATTTLLSTTKESDGCIPLTVEACQALGLNTTKLPNLLNQTSIQETLTVLEIFKMQSCSDNAMLYLCTMMYPSCDGNSLPCSDFCRSVQKECGNNFELAKASYCDKLPSTDCVNPEVTTTTTIQTTTTSVTTPSTLPTTTTTSPALCLTLEIPECQAVGHTNFMFPNFFGHNSVEEAMTLLTFYKNQSCSASSMYYLCNMLFPKCDPATGLLTYACQDHCNATYAACPSLTLAEPSYCNVLPTSNCEPKKEEALCLTLEIPECQAVGHTSVMFPNLFRHNTIEEAMGYFNIFKGKSCSASSMYFLCNILFPKCDPATGLLTYACQDHCNATYASCPHLQLASPTYCGNLPTSRCEPSYQLQVNTTTTQSITTTQSVATTTTQPITSTTQPVTTTTQPVTTSTTTPQPETTTTQPALCLTLEIPECQAVGHTSVMFPNYFGQNSIDEAMVYFNFYKNRSCSASSMYYLCNMLFSKCDPATGLMTYACQDHCTSVSASCPGLLAPQYCPTLPSTSCVPIYQDPVTTTTQPETTPQPARCLPLQIPECQSLGHTSVMLPNVFGHNSLEQATTYFKVFKNESCSASALYYTCNMLFPKCDPVTMQPIYACQNHCLDVLSSCPTLALANNSYCVQLPKTGCEPSYQNATTITTTQQPETTPQPELCYTTTVSECLAVNHTHFLLPNAFGDGTLSAAVERFEYYKNQSCSAKFMLYLCNMFFPSCNTSTGIMQFPCKSLCNEANVDCPNSMLSSPSYCNSLPVTGCVAGDTTQEVCETINAPECRGLGLHYTQMPNVFNHANLSAAKQFFDQFNQQSCSQRAVYYTCLMVFPLCDRVTGAIKYSCQEDCYAVNRECGNATQLAGLQYCPQLPTIGSGNCQPIPASLTTTPGPTTTISSTKTPGVCTPLSVPECQAVGRSSTMFPNLFGHTTLEEAHQVFAVFNRGEFCSQNAMYYLCSLVYPVCSEGVKINPCQSYCDDVQAECGTNFTAATNQYCDYLPLDQCVSGFPGVSTTQTPATTTQVLLTVPTTLGPRENCSETNRYTCPSNGKCIMKEWVCDGEPDCEDQSDEFNCGSCSSDQFTCLDRSCVPAGERCNKVPACPDESDERNCVSLTSQSILQLSSKPLCYQSWSDSLGPEVCKSLGLGNFSNALSMQYFSSQYVHLDINGQVPSHLGKTSVRAECQGAMVVALKCEPRGCGQRLVGSSQVGFIVGGNDAVPGYWPWQVSVQLKLPGGTTKHICGGSLVAPNFVLTATHCLSYLADRNVLIGATNRGVAEVTQKQYEIKRVIRGLENFQQYGPGDITLFELNDTVQFTPYIQPICFPEADEKFTETSICYATGWGYTTPGDKTYSTMLKELKMKLWSTSKCNSTAHWNGNITGGYLCAGYESNLKSVCTGDSGGPLVCKNNAGIWKLVGISSYVAINCSALNLPNVFTDVKHYLPWVKSELECKFKCDNGHCLFDRGMVCNRNNDCGDNSDETRLCNISVNCTFDDNYLCGYNASGFIWSYGASNSQAQSSLPWTDHTIGHYPGHFMFGKFGTLPEASLMSPKFQITVQSCVKFYYLRRGDSYDNMIVRTWEYSPSGIPISNTAYVVGPASSPDVWKLGYFDLSAGTYHLEFMSTELTKTALDDVKVVPGFCSQSVCDADMYRCADDKANPVCLPQSSICNVVVECNKDETNCQVNTTRYSCDFEKAMHCGISQMTYDKGEFIMMNGSYLQEKILYEEAFNEHTNNDSDAWMLFALTNLQYLIGNSVQMTQTLFLDNQLFCLSFYYRAQTDMTFKVSLESKGEVYELWSFTDRSTFDWTKAQMQLPLVVSGVLTYQLVRTTPPLNKYYKPYMAIDDISIIPGECPTFVCPEGTLKCASENFCYLSSQRCDRNTNCPDETDEANCTCTENEFSCQNGRCIPQSSACDKKVDCLDKSDEGTVCDPLRSMTCTFETPFSCGYTSNEGLYTWQRHSGATPSFYTGPIADHTLGDTTGHYFYVEGNNGVRGEIAVLTTPNVTTGVGQSLGFYYHIVTENEFTFIQSKGLSVIAQLPDGRSQLLWWQNQTSSDEWSYGCVNLPDNTHLNIQFVTRRIGLDNQNNVFDADVAVDDIALLLLPCAGDAVTTEPVSTPTPTVTPTVSDCAFRCDTGFCLESHQRCDGVQDCRNGEDELNCPS